MQLRLGPGRLEFSGRIPRFCPESWENAATPHFAAAHFVTIIANGRALNSDHFRGPLLRRRRSCRWPIAKESERTEYNRRQRPLLAEFGPFPTGVWDISAAISPRGRSEFGLCLCDTSRLVQRGPFLELDPRCA